MCSTTERKVTVTNIFNVIQNNYITQSFLTPGLDIFPTLSFKMNHCKDIRELERPRTEPSFSLPPLAEGCNGLHNPFEIFLLLCTHSNRHHASNLNGAFLPDN